MLDDGWCECVLGTVHADPLRDYEAPCDEFLDASGCGWCDGCGHDHECHPDSLPEGGS